MVCIYQLPILWCYIKLYIDQQTMQIQQKTRWIRSLHFKRNCASFEDLIFHEAKSGRSLYKSENASHLHVARYKHVRHVTSCAYALFARNTHRRRARNR